MGWSRRRQGLPIPVILFAMHGHRQIRQRRFVAGMGLAVSTACFLLCVGFALQACLARSPILFAPNTDSDRQTTTGGDNGFAAGDAGPSGDDHSLGDNFSHCPSVLLMEFDHSQTGTTRPGDYTDRTVSFHLRYDDDNLLNTNCPQAPASIGEEVLFPVGWSGTTSLTGSNQADFPNFSSCMTDGIDEVIDYGFGLNGAPGFTSYGGYESMQLHESPDLVGSTLSEVRLVVHSLDISYNQNQDRSTFTYEITWEFWGTNGSCP